ncbi:MAG: hydantoinase/oxoprolinase family protein [Chloroflexota bacterium]|nr:hydantoinase/oxoprolinase family protein [Chloroflexota bacterium]
MSRPRAGVDVGGTFTDLVAIENGRIVVGKVLSTPGDPSRGVLAGLAGLGVTDARAIVHGSTVATNAVLERKGARTALITTGGFRDVLEIGRQNRPDLYATEPVLPVPLVGRDLRREAAERVDHHGQVLTPLDDAALRETIAALSDAGVESCAVCLLFSFLNPEHERRTRDLLREAGFEYVSLSSDIIPEFREFERTSTVCLNAYVEPIMSAYLQRLADEAPGPLWIVQSNGGVLRSDEAAAEPVRTVLSGPAGGVVGALETAGRSGFDGIVTFDMGGTSTDVALCPGRPLLTNQGQVGGFPVAIGMIDIHTVGAGGGSLAYLDDGGALRVGPESAGADPGPAAYRRGGERPTVTDANVVLGRLPVSGRLGGTLQLDRDLAGKAVGQLAAAIPDLRDLDPATAIRRTALAILELANTSMEGALRVITVERGYDPREFTLTAFGGAGPVHACDLADRLHIPRVLIPRYPGVLSAMGCLAADRLRAYSRTVMLPAEAAHLPDIERVAAELEDLARADLAAESTAPELARALDMRYLGQSYELAVPWDEPGLDRVLAAFHEAHERRYTYSDESLPVEIVSVRVTGAVASPGLPDAPAAGESPPIAHAEKIAVTFGDAEVEASLLDREALRPGAIFDGPAILTQTDCTTVVPLGWTATVDDHLNLVLTRPAE